MIWFFILIAATFTFTSPCLLEMAFITFLEPNGAKVLLVTNCGAIVCWERWVQVEDKQLGYSRVCDPRGETHKLEIVK